MLTYFEKHNKLSWTITIFIAATIFYLSTLTFGAGTATTNLPSMIYHIMAFFFLAMFLFISSLKGKSQNKIFFLAAIIAILYGVSDELHQFFVPGRACSVFDILTDAVGVLFASLIYGISMKWREKNRLLHFEKIIKFSEPLPDLVLKGEKNITWRINDDKNIIKGDKLSLYSHKNKKEFAKARVLWIKETTFRKLINKDKQGHEKFSSDKEMYETYSKYSGFKVTPKTKLKVVKFKLIDTSNI